MLIEGLLPQVEAWVVKSEGKIRADVVHDRLLAVGFTGSDRTTRRAVAVVKAAYRSGLVRVHGAGDGQKVVITHLGGHGPVEVARVLRATPGSP